MRGEPGAGLAWLCVVVALVVAKVRVGGAISLGLGLCLVKKMKDLGYATR